MRHRRDGFTILELMLVLAILVMLAAMALPAIETMYADVRVQAASDHVRGRLAMARTRAIDDGRPYRLGVKVGTGDYRIAPDSSEFWGDSNAATPSEDDTLPAPLIEEGTLPSEIVFQMVGGARAESGGWTTLVTFLPNGACSDDCTIRLEREDARPIEIQIRALTGGVRAQSISLGGGK
jgi:prepilin-type N-terminal cleavage/methylation domain-containing protein